MLKSYRINESGFADDEDESFEAAKCEDVNENVDVVANIVATSTPQKNAAKQSECLGNV